MVSSHSLGCEQVGVIIGAALFIRFARGRGVIIFDQSSLDKGGMDLPIGDTLEFGEALLRNLDRGLA